MKRNTRILSSFVALAGLTLMPALSGMNNAQAKGKGHSGHDNGKHLGWSKGEHKGWSKSSKTWDRSDGDDRWDNRRDDRWDDRSTWKRSSTRNTVRNQWTKWRPATRLNSTTRWTPTPRRSVKSNWRRSNSRSANWRRSTAPRTTARPFGSAWNLSSTRPFGTRNSANRAATLRRQQGYRTAVAYDPNRRTYVLREYARRR